MVAKYEVYRDAVFIVAAVFLYPLIYFIHKQKNCVRIKL